MALSLQKSVTFEVCGHEVTASVNFRMLEIAEAVFDRSADMIIAKDLVNPASIKRSLVSRAIAEWIEPNTPQGLKKSEVIEFIGLSKPKDFGVFSGKLQAALAYSVSYISESDFSRLTGAKEAQSDGKKTTSSGVATE